MSLLEPHKPVHLSLEAKIARLVLNGLQLLAYILGFFAFIELLRGLLEWVGLSPELVVLFAWGAAIGLIVLAGWALQARDRS
jgi:hypothetical protein